MNHPGLDTGDTRDRNLFEVARDKFLQSLSASDRVLFSPCATSADFLSALDKLEVTTQHFARCGRKIRYVRSLAENLRPYFDIVNIFISSHPEFSAIFWGAFRLVLQLSSNLSSFFEKLLGLISQLLDVFPRYEDVTKLCNDENSDRIRRNIEEVYVDMLEIFTAAVKVFTKSPGKLKRTPVVVGNLLWQPFDVKFKELLERMAIHKHNIAEEIRIWKLRKEENERGVAAKWREYVRKECAESEKERHLAREERRLMTEERKLMEAERLQDSVARDKITSLLLEIKEEKERLEAERLESTTTKLQEWLKPSDHVDARHMNSKVRQKDTSTATWIFDHPQYLSWIESDEKSCPDGNVRVFGPNMLWLHGHPGSGKTVLATSILDELESGDNMSDGDGPTVLYHFFQFDSQSTRPPTAAYRSLLAQFLWQYRYNKDIVDKFAFIMTTKSQGQIDASEQALLDLLEICLDRGTFVILDGVDECENSDSFTASLLGLSHACNHKTLLLSRINMPHLQRSVRLGSRLPLPKEDISRDIHHFCERELKDMVFDGVLPDSTLDELDRLTGHLVNGADGMFLWARLMMEYLRLPTLSQARRVETITEIRFPEGLEYMYNRIFSVIAQSGPTTLKLAGHVFAWLCHQVALMTTHQTRQALFIDEIWPKSSNNEDISEFEDATVIACRGLVEIASITTGSSTRRVLKFVHLTVREVLTHSDPEDNLYCSSIPSKLRDISQPTASSLKLGRSCLRQLIYHTPSEPLSGELGESISSTQLSKSFPFTDYSALHWISHLGASIPPVSIRLDKTYKDAFDDFVRDLQTFLESPRTVSAWLEAYYTTQYDSPPRGQIVRRWASWVSEEAQRNTFSIKGALLGLVFEFRSDLDRIVKIWGINLTTSPHIVWDEVTSDGLAPSQLFFSPGSTRLRSRAPEKLQLEGIKTFLYSSTSTVSKDGSVLGVLSIWQTKKTGCVTALHNFLALYELWPLDLDRPRLARVLVDAQSESTTSLRIQVLNETMSISPDCLIFSFQNQLWRLKPSRPFGAKNLAEFEWPVPMPYETTTFQISSALRTPNIGLPDADTTGRGAGSREGPWTTYVGKTSFNPTGQYATITEKGYYAGLDRAIVIFSSFEVINSPSMTVKPLQTLEIKVGMNVIQHIFHPTLHFCVFLTEHSDKQSLYLWDFGTGDNNFSLVGHMTQACDAIEFSECGSYIVSRTRSTGAMTVMLIPRDLMTTCPELSEAGCRKEEEKEKQEQEKEKEKDPNGSSSGTNVLRKHTIAAKPRREER